MSILSGSPLTFVRDLDPSRVGVTSKYESQSLFDSDYVRLIKAFKNAPPLPELDDMPQIPEHYRELIVDRIESAWAENLIPGFTTEHYEGLMIAIMPEDFVIQRKTQPPSKSPKGTPERIKDYTDRANNNEPIIRDDDENNRPLRVKAVKGAWKENAGTVRITGWDDEKAKPLPAGNYVNSDGEHIELL